MPVDLYGTPANRYVAARDAAFAVACQKFLVGIRIIGRRIDMIDHPQRLAAGFVEMSLGIIYP